MSNTQDVLASLLQPGDNNQDTPRGDAAEALLNYFHGTIQSGIDESNNSNAHDGSVDSPSFPTGGRAPIPPFLPGSNTHEILSSRPPNVGRPVSPPNPSIRIPAAIEQLASNHVPPISIPLLDADAVMDAAFAYTDYGSYGEMGGKRRKAPHERAGWKEMDMDPTPRKRGRRGANETSAAAAEGGGGSYVPPSTAPDGSTGLEGLTDLTTEQGEALARAFSAHEATVAAEGSAHDAEPAGGEHDGGSRSRAEQNRRAQQVYRRKREERMKSLESAAAALEPVRKAYLDLVETTKELVMAFDLKSIENATLKEAIRTAASSGSVSFLTADGNLNTDRSTRKGAPSQPAAVEKAFLELEKQARELAKQHRRDRERSQGNEAQ